MPTPPRSLRLASALAAALALAFNAQAASRQWQFVGGCAAADWFGFPGGGTNSQGQTNCWSDGGLITGFSLPTANDDVGIIGESATTQLLVKLAQTTRTSGIAQAKSLTMYGNSSHAVGLSVDKLSLLAGSMAIGGSSGQLGWYEQSGGTVSVSGLTNVVAGDIHLTGGVLTMGSLGLSSTSGHASSFNQTAGTSNVGVVVLGNSAASNTTTATLRGSSVRMNGSGSAIVGLNGSATLAVLDGARLATGAAAIGAGSGVDGLVTVQGVGSSWTLSDGLAVGQLGTGRLVVSDGARVTASFATLNGAPALFGGALGAALDVSGAGSVVNLTGALSIGQDARSRMSLRDGAAVTSASGAVGSGALYRGNVDISGGASWAVAGDLDIGQAGVAVVSLKTGATLSSTTSTVGALSGAQGVLTLEGTGTSWTNTGRLTIGDAGQASVALYSGARLSSGLTAVGAGSGGASDIAVTGAGTRWEANGDVTIGSFSYGGMAAYQGGQIDTTGTFIAGWWVGKAGVLAVTGSGSRWEHHGSTTLGRQGSGDLTLEDGGWAQLNGAVTMAAMAGSSSRIDARDRDSTFVVTGALVTGAAAAGVLNFQSGSRGSANSLLLGQQIGATGDLWLSGAGTRFDVTHAVQLGQDGVAVLTVNGGASFNSGPAALAAAQWARGSATVAGAGSSWNLAGNLDVGQGGTGLLTISNGGLVAATGNTTTGNQRSQVVLDGGTLRSGSVLLGLGGQLDWRLGTVHVTGANGVALDGGQLPGFLRLNTGQNLLVDQQLTLPASSVLLLGGGQLEAGTLALQNGLLASVGGGEHALQMSGIGTLVGSGQVSVRIEGGSGMTHTIRASGALTLGYTGRSDGYSFGGWLDVGAHQVTLIDSDWAELGAYTTLNGGQLVTLNGARQGSGAEFRSNGAASVQGRFANNGQVLVENGELSFLDNVSGAGDFAGSVRFLAGYSPGNSTALIDFHGSEVSFGEHAVLTLEVEAGSADRLVNLARLDFRGTLVLAFAPGFSAEAGSQLDLLDYAVLTGGFDPARITITGLDGTLVDTSGLGSDGRIAFTAAVGTPPVPEPQTWALLLAGGLAVGGLARRRAARSA